MNNQDQRIFSTFLKIRRVDDYPILLEIIGRKPMVGIIEERFEETPRFTRGLLQELNLFVAQ